MPYPILAPQDTWYTQGGTTIKKSTITEIHIRDSYTPTGPVTAQWDASAVKDGSITVYIEGTVLTMAGNGSGGIDLSEDATCTFSDKAPYENSYSAVLKIDGLQYLRTQNTKFFKKMFAYMKSVKTINVSGFDTSNAESLDQMFSGIQGDPMTVERIVGIENFDVRKVKNFRGVFYANNGLTRLNLSSWRPVNATTLTYLFYHCHNLESVGDLSQWRTPVCEEMIAAFGTCPKLEKQRVENWDVHSCKYFSHMFADNASMSGTLDLSGWDMSNALDVSALINDCNQLEYLNVTGWNTKNVKAFGQLAERCASLRKIIGLETLDTSAASVIDVPLFRYQRAFSEMLSGCESMQELNLSNLSTASAFSQYNNMMANMLTGMIRLEKLTLGPDFDVTGSDPAALPLPPTPDPAYIPGADGHWYDRTGKAYTPEEAIKTVPNVYYASKAVLYGSELAVMDRAQMREIAEYVRKSTGRTELMRIPDVFKAMVDHSVSHGVTGAKKGDLFRVKEVDSKGVPTALEPVTVEELDGKWELIEEFTTTKNEAIIRTQEPDGTPYAFRGMRVYLSNISSASGSPYLIINVFDPVAGTVIADALYWEAAQNNKEAVMFLEPSYGFYSSRNAYGPKADSLKFYVSNNYRYPITDLITQFESAGNVPAGIKIRIEALR